MYPLEARRRRVLRFVFMMRHVRIALLLAALFLPILAADVAAALTAEEKSATVFIANYDSDDDFLGWGSGFFVDEGIVVTNKHVLERADWHRVYATGSDGNVDLACRKNITKSDVKVNLDDDVAYMRVYLDCAHGELPFADDPALDDPVWVLGYPYREGSVSKSMILLTTSGTVTATSADEWYGTDAAMDVGNSGGPVVGASGVVGVAVAKGVDAEGRFVTGYFVPSSIIERGLLYANDSRFGYTPQSRSSIPRSSVRSSFSSASSVSFDDGDGPSSSPVRSSSRSSRSSARPFPDVPPHLEGHDAIMELRGRGIVAGYADGRFHPDRGINRAEFLKILVEGFRPREARGEERCFRDVREEWFAEYVCAAERLGWVGGYPDGSFHPEQLVNRAEAMKIVVEALGGDARRSRDLPSDVRAGTWFHPYVAAGVTLGIVDPDARFRPGDDLTRADAAIWIEGAEKD